MTHTPGPWEFEECYKHNGYTHHIRTDEVGGFALVDGFENANLIAAAPDLLVAAHDVLAWADEQGIETENGEFHDLQAAVLKAMGETND
jgi:hypothetical protein